MLASLRWYLAKRRVMNEVADSRVHTLPRQSTVEHFPANSESYEKLAPLWEDILGRGVPHYGRLLETARSYYRCPVRTVLDLACGTGLLTRQFALWTDSVVGLDINEHML